MNISIKRFLRAIATVIFLSAAMMLLLTGCGADEAGDKLKDLEFTVVGENDQPDALKSIIAEKSKVAFQISYTIGEDLYIAIGYGEQPSGGYSISVNEFYETEKAIFVDTTLIGPSTAQNVTDTPTTPYVVIKTKNIEDKPIEFK